MDSEKHEITIYEELEGAEIDDTPNIYKYISWKLLLKLLSIVCIILIFIILFSCTIALTVVVSTSGDDDDSSNSNKVPKVKPILPTSDQNVSTTSEYQISLDFDESWLDREAVIDEWMEYFSNNCEYYDGENVESTYNVRRQYNMDLSECGYSTEIRVREYTEGYNSPKTTIDIKGNSKHEEKACALTFWPSDSYNDISSQKCEQDFHDCSTKFSRETRLTFEDTAPKLETCVDVIQLFPYAFDNIRVPYLWNPIEKETIYNWYLREFTGYLNDSTKFKIAFTLRYESENQAKNGDVVPNYGEWSIRIYTKDDGVSDSYDQDVVYAVNNVWQDMMTYFDCHDNCD